MSGETGTFKMYVSAGNSGSLGATLVTNESGSLANVTMTAMGGTADVPVGDVKIDTLGMWTAPNNTFYALTVQQTGFYLLTSVALVRQSAFTPLATTGWVQFFLRNNGGSGDLASPVLSFDEFIPPSFSPSTLPSGTFNCSLLAWLESGTNVEWFGSNYTDVDMIIDGLVQNSLGATLIHT